MDDHPLKKWRNKRGLKLRPAAEQLGVDAPTLCRYENYRRFPSLEQATKLSDRTGIPIRRFLKTAEAVE